MLQIMGPEMRPKPNDQIVSPSCIKNNQETAQTTRNANGTETWNKFKKQIECQIDDRSKKTAEMARQLALEFTLHNTQSMAYTLACF